MNRFVPSKIKLIEFLIMLVLAVAFYFIYPDFSALVLFLLGFIWNWSAANDLSEIFQQKQYRFSMLRLVVSLQDFFLRPFRTSPDLLRRFIRILPAGFFWGAIIYLNESIMPWWATFLGSLSFEIMHLELFLFNKNRIER